MINEQVLYAITHSGQAQTSAAFTGVSKAITGSGNELDSYSKKTQKAASLMTALSGAVGGISPQFAALGAGAGRAAPAIEALTGLIGGGVGAAVAGGLIGVIGLASAAWKLYGESQDVAKASAADLNVTLESQLELIQKMDRAANLRSAVAEGVAGPEAQLAEVRRLEAERDRIRGRMNQLRSDDDKFTLVDGSQREFARLAERDRANAAALERARVVQKQALQEETEFYDSGEAEDEKPVKKAQISENEKRIAALRALEEKNYTEGSARMLELDRAALVLRGDQHRSALETEIEMEKAAATSREMLRKQSAAQQLSDEQFAYEERKRLDEKFNDDQARRAEESYGTAREIATETYSAISGAIASSLAAAIVGEDVSTKQVLKGLGKQVATMGLVNLLQAPVDLFWNPPKAAAEFAAGTAQLALGAALGAGGGGGGSAGGGGGGGSLPGGRPTSPTFIPGSTDTGAKNPQPQIINHYHSHPAIVSPSADDGLRSKRAMEEARRQGDLP